MFLRWIHIIPILPDNVDVSNLSEKTVLTSADRGGAMKCLKICLVATGLALCAAGCTSWRDYFCNGFKVGPNYREPCTATAQNWIDEGNPHISSAAPNDAAWWQTLNDPILNSLIYTAYRQNLTLRAAGMRIMEARAQRNIAAGNLFPQTQQAAGDYARTNNSKNSPVGGAPWNYDEWQVGVNLSWELDFWGRFRRAIEAADATLDATVENYDDVLVLLLSDVAQRYVEVRTAEQRLKYAEKNVEIQRESLNLANVKFTNGATTKLDVTQGESTLGQTEAIIPPLEAQRRAAMNQICILLGAPPQDIEAILGGRQSIPFTPPEIALGIPADLLRRRPDIRRAEREVAAQSARIGVATAELYPHFSINGTVSFDAENFKDLFASNSLDGAVGPAFNWNILNYGRLVNAIRVQDARFNLLAFNYQNLVLQANAEVENGVTRFLNAQRQVKYLATATRAATESVELVRAQYDAGKTDFNRVLVVEQSLTTQEDQLAVAEGSVVQNLVQIYKALGGGWQVRTDNTAYQTPPAIAQPGALAPASVR
jgi:NodT family efflux transporter outer membrane factor (OMF) lipoprotein